MSRVFVAHDASLGRDIVVKVLPPEMAAEVSAQRFKREIQLAARLQHPHIVPLHSAGEAGGLPYFTMPFVEGETLRARISHAHELPIPECVRVLRDIATALAYAHTHGVVHRDIKPENVLLTGGSAVVTDFGVAKAISAATSPGGNTLTSRGVALGTPSYMSPEQAAADPAIDHRTDIYSLGVLAYEMLAGRAPFAGRPQGATIAAHIAEAPEPIDRLRPTVPAALADVVMRCLAKRPADRPQSADEVVQTLDAIVSTGVSTRTSPAQAHGTRAVFGTYRWVAVAVLALIAIVAAVLLLPNRRGDAAAVAEATVRSIAVLPFVNLAPTADDEYFSEGMSDELSAALGRIRGLQVASRTSTFAFKDAPNPDIRDIGQKLRVDAVLEGRVRRSGNRLRLNVQLTNVATGLGMWADSYEREVKDVFAVQDEIARSIAAALQVRLAPAVATTNLAAGGTENLQAYDAYLRGRYAWHRRGAENLRVAARQFERAVELDPRFARAYGGIAITYALLPEYTDAAPVDSPERTERAVSQALALDSTIAEAYTALGLAHVHAWRWEEAERAYRRAIAIDPRYATAHQWYGELLYHVGRLEEAVVETGRSVELDPLAPIAAVANAYALYASGRSAESVREGRRAIELAPTLGILYRTTAFALAAAGDTVGALRHMERSAQLDPELALALGELAFMQGFAGQRNMAVATLRKLESKGSTRRKNQFALALAYIGVGNREAALTAFERAVDGKEIPLSSYSLGIDPMLSAIRDDPRFTAALGRMNFPESAWTRRERP